MQMFLLCQYANIVQIYCIGEIFVITLEEKKMTIILQAPVRHVPEGKGHILQWFGKLEGSF